MDVSRLIFPFAFLRGRIVASTKCFFFSIIIADLGLKSAGTNSLPSKLEASSAGISSHCSATTSISVFEIPDSIGSLMYNSGRNPFSGLLMRPVTCKNLTLPFPGTFSVTDFCQAKFRITAFWAITTLLKETTIKMVENQKILRRIGIQLKEVTKLTIFTEKI